MRPSIWSRRKPSCIFCETRSYSRAIDTSPNAHNWLRSDNGRDLHCHSLHASWGSVGFWRVFGCIIPVSSQSRIREHVCEKRARITAVDRIAGMAICRTNTEHRFRTKQSSEAMERRSNNRGDCCIRAIPARSQTRTIASISSDGSCVPLAPGENKTRVERNSGT
jgi:hypothetical protein